MGKSASRRMFFGASAFRSTMRMRRSTRSIAGAPRPDRAGVSRDGDGWHRSTARNSAPWCSTTRPAAAAGSHRSSAGAGRRGALSCATPRAAGAIGRPRHPASVRNRRRGRCDAVLVVTAPAEVQRARVLARPGMTADKFEAILARQMPDAEKRRRAHFIVDTSRGFASAEAQVRSIVTCSGGTARARCCAEFGRRGHIDAA